MGREIRRVPKDWEHPKETNQFDNRGGGPRPLHEPSKPVLEMLRDWLAKAEAWQAGDKSAFEEYSHGSVGTMPYWEYGGGPPDPTDYMPHWSESEKTHYQMYETCTEGTPISPVFATPEEVARWCADNGASSFADQTATYEQWLAVAKGRDSVSAVLVCGRGLISGVEVQHQLGREKQDAEDR